MLDRGDAAEGVATQVFLAAAVAGAHGLDAVGRALLLHRQHHRPQERAAGNSVNDELAHDRLLLVGSAPYCAANWA